MTQSVQKRAHSVVSIRTIAEATGVSLNTVSLSLKGSDRVRPETRERIVAAAQELGYQPNLLARAVITGRLWVARSPSRPKKRPVEQARWCGN